MKIAGRHGNDIIGHVAFWLLYVFIRVVIVQLYPGALLYRLGMELVELPLKMAALYFAIYVLIRKLLLQKRYQQFVVVFIGYLIVVTVLNRIEDYYVIYPLIGDSIAQYDTAFWNLNASFLRSSITRYEDGFWNLNAAFLNLIYIYPVVGLGAAFYFTKAWYDDHLNHERILREKLKTELKFLKDQLHPHFLFNTLNNIYSLALQQSEKAPAMILKLSDLLSFMIYDGNANRISLRKELQALSDYIEMERLRLGDRLQLTFTATGDLDGKMVAPLILFPFVENCFKHSGHKTTENVWISFNLVVTGDVMTVQVENSVPDNVPIPAESTGIGLRNVQRRLDLLYPDKYSFTIHQEGSYLVKLKLTLV